VQVTRNASDTELRGAVLDRSLVDESLGDQGYPYRVLKGSEHVRHLRQGDAMCAAANRWLLVKRES
jgi:hypothetical protein